MGVQPSDFDSFGVEAGDHGSNKAAGKLKDRAMVTPERSKAAARTAIVPTRGTPVPRTPQPVQAAHNIARPGDDEETATETVDIAKTSVSKAKVSKEKRPRQGDEGKESDKSKSRKKKKVDDDE